MRCLNFAQIQDCPLTVDFVFCEECQLNLDFVGQLAQLVELVQADPVGGELGQRVRDLLGLGLVPSTIVNLPGDLQDLGPSSFVCGLRAVVWVLILSRTGLPKQYRLKYLG